MTEAYEDGKYLVRVRAQVMMRDDSTGGWLPMGGGGLSNVSVRKRAITCDRDESKHEYLIFGQRLSDQSTVLSCTMKKDFVYNKVMPTFHHWTTGDKKFGLTFQTAADARAFDKGVLMAVRELLEGKQPVPIPAGPAPSPPALRADEGPFPQISQLGLSEMSPLHNYNAGVGDDDVFMTLNLPVEMGDSSYESSKGGGGSSRHPTPPTESHHHRIHYVQRRDKKGSDQDPSPPEGKQQQQREEGGGGAGGTGGGVGGSEKDNYSYVQLTAVHEYIYPVMEDQKTSRRDSAGSLKKRSLEVIPTQPPLLPSKPSGKKKDRHKACRTRCRHCQELYSEDENARGSCEYAPDCVRSGINAVTCIEGADCVLYHFMSDAEGDSAQHPCECSVVDKNCGQRWLCLAVLSLLFPCLWCYPPLRACHWCCVSCGICGGRHRPTS